MKRTAEQVAAVAKYRKEHKRASKILVLLEPKTDEEREGKVYFNVRYEHSQARSALEHSYGHFLNAVDALDKPAYAEKCGYTFDEALNEAWGFLTPAFEHIAKTILNHKYVL